MIRSRSLYAVTVILVLFIIVIAHQPNEKMQTPPIKEDDEMVHHNDIMETNSRISPLKRRIDAVLNKETHLEGAIAGVSVRSAETGKLMYEYLGDIRLHPASNMKLLTGAAALSVLGPDYTMSTQLLVDGEIEAGVLNGDLYIKGKGDPTLTQETFQELALVLKEKGINRIQGNVIGDDTWYDDERLSQDLNWSDETYYYGAQISALTASPNADYDAGSIIVAVQPGKVGEPPTVKLMPGTDYVQVKNSATTMQTGDADEDLTVKRDHGTNIIRVSGTLPEKDVVYEWISIWEPTRYAVSLFQKALREQGIIASLEIETKKTPDEARLIHTHTSMALEDLLVPFMKLSNNTIGEMLIKELGRLEHGEGSWEKGLEVLNEEMQALGMNMETILVRDGSGISHVNAIPANELTKLLYTVRQKSWFPSFAQSLPVAGESKRLIGGTLRNRMPKLDVKAKTGTINGVSTLSGYVNTDDDTLIFSILLNNLLDDEDGPDIEDQLVEAIANK